eukprot:scaffold945_cov82-Cylindrotheca_fusiformis.AAC.8
MVIDTGASISITPNKSDFVSRVTPSRLTSITGLTGSTQVVGSGTVEWTVRDCLGAVQTIRTTAYLENRAGSLLVEFNKTILTLADQSTLQFPYQANNIPMMLGATATVAGLDFHDMSYIAGNPEKAFMSVADENNQNLTAAEKELLLLHAKLGHSHFQWVQRLLAQPRNQDQGPILRCRHPGASSTSRRILCAACELGKQARRPPEGRHTFDEHNMEIRANDLLPGSKVSIDSYISSVPGRLPHTRGKENAKDQYNGGTIFCDHVSSAIFVVNQISLRAGETLQAKWKFENWCKSNNVPKIKSYRADHVPFNSEAWRNDLALKDQDIDFSGVGAHHQNAVAERSIQTVTKWARTILLHHLIHWPEAADVHLWPFALEHAVFIWNHLPRRDSLIAPIEILSQSRFPTHDILHRLHVWGCPTYVLDPKLQDGKKLPKWKPRARRGMYLGGSFCNF